MSVRFGGEEGYSSLAYGAKNQPASRRSQFALKIIVNFKVLSPRFRQAEQRKIGDFININPIIEEAFSDFEVNKKLIPHRVFELYRQS